MAHEGKTGRNVEEITASPLSLYEAETARDHSPQSQ